jgi:inhibitor of cysteine peptidase
MMRTLLVACALAPGACTGGGEAKQEASPNQSRVPAPTPDDVTVRITAAQNGQTIEVPVNQRFAIELVGVPTAGYQWAPTQLPAFIIRAGEATGNTIAAQSQPGYTGGNHWEVLMFSATSPGTGELVLEQRRPWETGQPASNTFRVTITAR